MTATKNEWRGKIAVIQHAAEVIEGKTRHAPGPCLIEVDEEMTTAIYGEEVWSKIESGEIASLDQLAENPKVTGWFDRMNAVAHKHAKRVNQTRYT